MRLSFGVVMATDTRNDWLRFLAAGIVFSLGSCSSESNPAQLGVDDEPGAMAGEFAVYIASFDDGTAETKYFLKQRDGAERPLHFSVAPDVTPGAHLKVWGMDRADRIEVSRYQVTEGALADEGAGVAARPLIDGSAKRSPVLCAALINVNGGTAKSTVSTIKTQFHTGPASANAFYVENSFGQVDLPGDAYGPFEYSMTTCDYRGLAKAIKTQIDAMATTKCHQYAFVMEPSARECGWATFATVGMFDTPTSDSWYNASTRCVDVVQGPGQNYGMQHSSSITCAGNAFADDLSGCTHDEYGDPYDAMGGGCHHMNAWQKLYQRWFGGCNGVRTTSNGKFNLYPIEAPCDGVQVLQVPFPGGRARLFQNTTLTSYYLELRTNVGFDSEITTPQVLLHAGGAPALPTPRSGKGLHTWIISAGSPGMTAGQSFTDPAGGLTISVDSVDATHAVVDINYAAESGTPVCLDGSDRPFTPPGPTDCTTPSTPGDAAPPAAPDAMADAVPPAPPDAMADTGASGAAGSSGDASGGTGTIPPAPEPSDGGCSCELAATGGSEGRPLSGLLMLGLAIALRRRSRRLVQQHEQRFDGPWW
jgi:hypothetical protein